jgi:hypothetical protein
MRDFPLATLRARLWPFAADLLFGLLVIFNTIRLFRHAMWRDELQAFMLAAASSTPLDLYAKLKYEGHPGLWHLLLWVITRFTADPFFMQVLHLVIALGIWALIWRLAPFRPIEKLLLLLSFFLFWEYFVLSRPYALGVLLGFSYIALRVWRPTQLFWPWVLLGLLANTSLFGAIWSFALALVFAWEGKREGSGLLSGAVVYAALLALAIATMSPAPDFSFGGGPRLQYDQLDMPLHFMVGSYFPFIGPFLADTLKALGLSELAATPFALDPANQIFFLLGGGSGQSLIQALVLTLPIVACFLIVGNPARTAEFAVTYLGTLLFAQLWQYPGGPRHYGFLFVALVGALWMARSVAPATGRATWLWMTLLVINALAGLTTLAADARPYSQSRNTAIWLQRHNLAGAFLVGSPDYAVSSISGYLQRPIYYLECECFGTHVTWNTRRKHELDIEDVVARVARVMQAEDRNDAYLISSRPLKLGSQTLDPHLAFRKIKQFPAASVPDETYAIYRVKRQ